MQTNSQTQEFLFTEEQYLRLKKILPPHFTLAKSEKKTFVKKKIMPINNKKQEFLFTEEQYLKLNKILPANFTLAKSEKITFVKQIIQKNIQKQEYLFNEEKYLKLTKILPSNLNLEKLEEKIIVKKKIEKKNNQTQEFIFTENQYSKLKKILPLNFIFEISDKKTFVKKKIIKRNPKFKIIPNFNRKKLKKREIEEFIEKIKEEFPRHSTRFFRLSKKFLLSQVNQEIKNSLKNSPEKFSEIKSETYITKDENESFSNSDLEYFPKKKRIRKKISKKKKKISLEKFSIKDKLEIKNKIKYLNKEELKILLLLINKNALNQNHFEIDLNNLSNENLFKIQNYIDEVFIPCGGLNRRILINRKKRKEKKKLKINFGNKIENCGILKSSQNSVFIENGDNNSVSSFLNISESESDWNLIF